MDEKIKLVEVYFKMKNGKCQKIIFDLTKPDKIDSMAMYMKNNPVIGISVLKYTPIEDKKL